MRRENYGYGLIVLGVILVVVGIFVGSKSADERISERYQMVANTDHSVQTVDGIDKRWTCGDRDPIEVGRELRDEIRPQVYSENAGAAYLRTEKHLFIVSRTTANADAAGDTTADTCLITRESLGGRYSGGHFIYLGPGFSPSAPASGSGGSSGSYGGAK